MATYNQTQDDDIVIKEVNVDSEINLNDLISTYLELKEDYLNLPTLKTVPDVETLQFYNREKEMERASALNVIQTKAVSLYTTLTDIRSAGLLPVRFENGYQTLKTFVEGF